MPYVTLVIGLLVALGRFTVLGHDLSWEGTYEALAHIWVGCLLWECLGRWMMAPSGYGWWDRVRLVLASWAGVQLIVLTTLEIVMFAIR